MFLEQVDRQLTQCLNSSLRLLFLLMYLSLISHFAVFLNRLVFLRNGICETIGLAVAIPLLHEGLNTGQQLPVLFLQLINSLNFLAFYLILEQIILLHLFDLHLQFSDLAIFLNQLRAHPVVLFGDVST